jgi:hypothetical protein
MFDFKVDRCMIFCTMLARLFFEVVFLLFNDSACFWDERSNFRDECQKRGMNNQNGFFIYIHLD